MGKVIKDSGVLRTTSLICCDIDMSGSIMVSILEACTCASHVVSCVYITYLAALHL
jgi:hypothetical protein